MCLSACNQIPVGPSEPHGIDVLDRVRSLDLLPRFPQPADPGDQTAAATSKPVVYHGVIGSAIGGARPQPATSGEGYDLNFENTPTAAVAKVILGDILGVGYTLDPRTQGTVSLTSGRSVPKSDLLFVLESALRMNGISLIRESAGYRLVPLADAAGTGNLDSAEARAEPGYGVSVVPLRYVSATTLIKLLDSFATKPGMVRADAARNLLLIQGTGPERRSTIDTVLGFDVDWMRGQSVGIFPIRYGSPEPIIMELERILDAGEGGLGENTVKFQVIARMNAVLVVTRKPDLMRAAENWIKRLDNANTSRTSMHLYRVKYGDARQLAGVLNDVFVGGSSGSYDTPANQVSSRSGLGLTASADRLSPASGSQAGTATSAGTAAASGFGSTGNRGLGSTPTTLGSNASSAMASALDARSSSSGGVGAGGNHSIFDGVRITADAVGNTLLIYASAENYQIIEQTLAQLDRPQMQVAIDATVAEVTLNDNLAYGVQFFLKSQFHGVPGNISNIPTSPPGAASTGAGGLVGAALNRAFPGFNFLVGSDASPNVVLDALHTVTTLKVLSNPSLVVIDNQVANLVVGNDVPISTGTANVLTTSNTIVNTIDYRSVGIILRVAPHINVNGNVRLDIEQEISQVSNASNTDTSGTPNLTPTFSQRKVKSSIAIASGQTVLLAGLIQEQQEGDRGGIPLLDQLPRLGDAFSHQTRGVSRTELIVFIRPQIIRDGVDAHFVAEELRTKLRGVIGVVEPDVPPSPKLR